MTIETKRQHFTQEIPVAWECDACGTREEAEEEAQEWLAWRHTGGYASVYGDGEDVSLDLCQACTKALLGHAIKTHGNIYDPSGPGAFGELVHLAPRPLPEPIRLLGKGPSGSDLILMDRDQGPEYIEDEYDVFIQVLSRIYHGAQLDTPEGAEYSAVLERYGRYTGESK